MGQDLVIRGNPQLSSLEGLTASLCSVGAFRGADVFIEDNAQLFSLSGLEGPSVRVFGSVTVSGNSPQLPAAAVEALQAKAVPVPITIETLANGLPSNVTGSPAAAQPALIKSLPGGNTSAALPGAAAALASG